MTAEQIERFIKWRVYEGLTLKEIASRLACSPMELLELEAAEEQRIKAEQRIRLDNLLHESGADSKQRQEYLTGTYKRLAQELEKRDFSGLPTDKLYYILNDLHRLLLAD
ncbi:MAG: hypothetical protein D6677_12850 [Calditrichaeota bacterium]|nr:MAG: hypothetical protein D6677_12850 [Calditrichota bacterium]